MSSDVWLLGGAYEDYVGRWSRRVAEAFVPWLEVPAGGRWLDVGCGTGALAGRVLSADAARVVGLDPSGGFLAHARSALSDPRLAVVAGDAQAVPLRDRCLDAVVGGLVVNFLGDPGRALAEFARVTVPGGTIAAYVWDYADGMEMIRHFWDAAVALDAAAAPLDEGRRFPLCRPEPLARLWADAGLDLVVVRDVTVATRFADLADYWTPFLGGQGPAPAYAMSRSEEQRRALRDLLEARLPVQADGTIRLTARAWAVKGTRT